MSTIEDIRVKGPFSAIGIGSDLSIGSGAGFLDASSPAGVHTIASRPASSGSSRMRGLKVLVCESDYVLAIDVSEHISAMGAIVLGSASNVGEAEALVQEHAAATDMVIVARHLGECQAQSIASRMAAMGIPTMFYAGTAPGEMTSVSGPM